MFSRQRYQDELDDEHFDKAELSEADQGITQLCAAKKTAALSTICMVIAYSLLASLLSTAVIMNTRLLPGWEKWSGLAWLGGEDGGSDPGHSLIIQPTKSF